MSMMKEDEVLRRIRKDCVVSDLRIAAVISHRYFECELGFG